MWGFVLLFFLKNPDTVWLHSVNGGSKEWHQGRQGAGKSKQSFAAEAGCVIDCQLFFVLFITGF